MDPVLAKFIADMTFLVGGFTIVGMWIYLGWK